MTMRPVALTLHAEDVGGTIAVELRINDVPCFAWLPGTGHKDYALSIAEETASEMLREVFASRTGQVVHRSVEDIRAARRADW